MLGAVLSAGASLIGGAMQKSSADKSARMQQKAAEQVRRDLAPYRDAGQQGLDAQMSALGFGEDGYNPDPLPDYSIEALSEGFETSPGYQFMVDEMMRSVENSAAGRGMLQSGPTLKALQRNASGIASQEYYNYLNQSRQSNYDTENSQQRRIGNLQQLASMGQNSAAQTGQAGMSAAANAGNMRMSGSAAMASGLTGAANAYQGHRQNQMFFDYLNRGQG